MRICTEKSEKDAEDSSTGAFLRFLWSDEAHVFTDFPRAAVSLFPEDEAARIGRFVREEDRQSRYCAAGLLSVLLTDSFRDISPLRIVRTETGRPRLDDLKDVDISISHSGGIVVVALSTVGRIGVDVEKIRPIETDDFERVFPASLWRQIFPPDRDAGGADRDEQLFFDAWTRFESVLKADGRGLLAPVGDIVFDGNTAVLNDSTWHCTTAELRDGYAFSFAAENADSSGEIVYISGQELIERCNVLSGD